MVKWSALDHTGDSCKLSLNGKWLENSVNHTVNPWIYSVHAAATIYSVHTVILGTAEKSCLQSLAIYHEFFAIS